MSASNPFFDRLEADRAEHFDPDHMRAWDFGTACAIDAAWYDRQKPSCPLCGMTGWHRDSCPTKKEQS